MSDGRVAVASETILERKAVRGRIARRRASQGACSAVAGSVGGRGWLTTLDAAVAVAEGVPACVEGRRWRSKRTNKGGVRWDGNERGAVLERWERAVRPACAFAFSDQELRRSRAWWCAFGLTECGQNEGAMAPTPRQHRRLQMPTSALKLGEGRGPVWGWIAPVGPVHEGSCHGTTHRAVMAQNGRHGTSPPRPPRSTDWRPRAVNRQADAPRQVAS